MPHNRSGEMVDSNPNGSGTGSELDVLTFVMTVEYNGFQYAGFQRQTATRPRNNNDGNMNGVAAPATSCCDAKGNAIDEVSSVEKRDGISENHKRNHPQESNGSQQQRPPHPPNKRAKKNTSTPITVQHQIETALQKWTSLSIGTLRVRGAGRTDKGVHASGQVVAFDVPLSLLHLDGCSVRKNGDLLGCNGRRDQESLSQQSIQYLQEALDTLNEHRSKTTCENKTEKKSVLIDQWKIRRAITTRLPLDIVLRSVRLWTGACPFEARKQISCKTYTYKLRFRGLSHLNCSSVQSSSSEKIYKQQHNGDDKKPQLHPICSSGPPLLRRINDQNTVWLCPWPLDPMILHQACAKFVGKHDFINFVHKEERRKASRCAEGDANNTLGTDLKSPHEINLFQFQVDTQSEKEEDWSLPPVINAIFTLKAKGFHRSMVRNLVGFAVDIARGLRRVDDIPVLLMEQDPCINSSDNKTSVSMVNSAPACGLCLSKVEYEKDLFFVMPCTCENACILLAFYLSMQHVIHEPDIL